MDTAITELEELTAEKVSGVGSPANGTPWVVLKSTDVQADPASPHTTSPEADAQEAEMTKAEADEIEALLTKAEASGFCGVDDCEVCKEHFGPMHEELVKRKLKMKDRKKIPKGDFAIPEKAPASGSYPLNDEAHARNALARASGKPVEARVRAAVRRKYPNIKIEKMSPGVPAFATETPKAKGTIDGSRSGLAGPMTAGADPLPAQGVGGQSPYRIPAETKVTNNPPYHAEKSWEVEVVDKQNWVSYDNTQPEPNEASANSSVLNCIVNAFVSLKAALAAQKADPDGMTEAFDAQVWAHLEDACGSLKNALIDQAFDIAGLDAGMIKATDPLAKSGEAVTTAGNGARTSEEENIMSTITKEELASFISESAGVAVKEALKAERKAEKAKMKMKTKGKKMPPEVEKNANNGGDITEGTMRGEVHGSHEANDVNSVPSGGHVNGEYVNKEEKEGKKDKALKAVATDLAEVKETLAKMAQRPRSGGPVLDGQARGAFPASEGRQTETVAKGTEDPEVERLEKELDETMQKNGPEAAARASDLSYRLTRLRLYNAHKQGII